MTFVLDAIGMLFHLDTLKVMFKGQGHWMGLVLWLGDRKDIWPVKTVTLLLILLTLLLLLMPVIRKGSVPEGGDG